MTTTITPYLFFAGKCEEALSYYEKALGAKIEMMMRNLSVPRGITTPGQPNIASTRLLSIIARSPDKQAECPKPSRICSRDFGIRASPMF